jgi:hypothetical protein
MAPPLAAILRAKEHRMLELLDPLQLAVCRLTLYRDSDVHSVATGFFHQLQNPDGTPHISLITNWHVLSGRNSDTPLDTLHSQQMIPNKVGVKLILGPNADQPGVILSQEFTISLFDENGKALWLEHPSLGHLVDVAAIKIGNLLSHVTIRSVNAVADTYDMSIGLGDPVLILGYPRGFSHFMETPIWKHGVIASEPTLETDGSRKRIMIDSTTRSGMSGSPVLVRGQTHYVATDGTIKQKARPSCLIGVYASRPKFQKIKSDEDTDAEATAEIGYVYKAGVINEILLGNKLAPDYGCPP